MKHDAPPPRDLFADEGGLPWDLRGTVLARLSEPPTPQAPAASQALLEAEVQHIADLRFVLRHAQAARRALARDLLTRGWAIEEVALRAGVSYRTLLTWCVDSSSETYFLIPEDVGIELEELVQERATSRWALAQRRAALRGDDPRNQRHREYRHLVEKFQQEKAEWEAVHGIRCVPHTHASSDELDELDLRVRHFFGG